MGEERDDVDDEDEERYIIMKFWSPESGKEHERFGEETYTLAEAQEICGDPSASFRLGPAKEHYFLGFTRE